MADQPTILVIFGATGDVVAKKIIPALFDAFENKKLPSLFRVLGFSRRDLTTDVFQTYVRDLIATHAEIGADDARIGTFLNLFSYQQGQFDQDDDYRKLAEVLGRTDGEWRTCSNKLFYLAVPPTVYERILTRLASSGLTTPCGGDEGWTRILVEKPIGSDAQTAEKLNELLGSLFQESQIYRIEHYLAKEMIRNILTFRFSNALFEPSWSRESIERIDIRLWESIGVEKRGAFYDGVGALRDVGQNHLLQMLALVTMDRPASFEADDIRSRRAEVLQALRPLSAADMAERTVRAQYEGYRAIDGVAPDSQTETYFKIIAELDKPRWKGVPITIESGKRMKEQRKDITVTFKPPGNRVIFTLEPEEAITIEFWAKKPGHGYDVERRTFDFLLRDAKKRSQYVEEYEKLLLDGIRGDQTLFVNTAELRAMWRFIDPIVRAWQNGDVPLKTYPPDTLI